jgi:hypothetical protein
MPSGQRERRDPARLPAENAAALPPPVLVE